MHDSYDEMTRRAEDAERRLRETHELTERLSKETGSAKREWSYVQSDWSRQRRMLRFKPRRFWIFPEWKYET